MSEPAEHEEELRFPLLRHEVPPLSSSEPVPPAATAAAEEAADDGEVADGPLTRAKIESATTSEERQSAANATAGRRRREYTALSDSESSSDGPATPELTPAVQQLMSRGSAEVDAPERFPPLVQCRCLHTLCEYDVLCSHCAQGDVYAALDALSANAASMRPEHEACRLLMHAEHTEPPCRGCCGRICLPGCLRYCLSLSVVPVPACLALTPIFCVAAKDLSFLPFMPCFLCFGLSRWSLCLPCAITHEPATNVAKMLILASIYDGIRIGWRAFDTYGHRRRLRARYGIPASQNCCSSDLLTKLLCWHCSVCQEHKFMRSKYHEASNAGPAVFQE